MTNEAYFDNEEFREILADYEQTVSSGSMVFMDVDDMADIADYYQLHKRYEEAQQVINRIIELEPQSTIALNYKVHEALDNEDYEAAEQYLSEMEDDQDLEYIYCRAEIWIAQDMIDKADAYLQEHLTYEDEKDYQDYVLDVVNMYNEYDYTEKAMQWLMKANPNKSDEFKELTIDAYMGMALFDEVEKLFNELLDKHPFESKYWQGIAYTQFMKEDYPAAITSSEYGIAINPKDTECLMIKANALSQLSNQEEACDFYRRIISIDPENYPARVYLSNTLINMKKFKEAVDLLEQSIATTRIMNRYGLDVIQNLAFAYNEMGHLDKALSYLDKTDSMTCDHNEIKTIRGHMLLAHNHTKEAVQAFMEAIKDSGENPNIILRVIVSIYDNQYLSTAYRLFKRFFQFVDDDWNEGYAYMTLCCYDLTKNDEYLHYLQEAVKRNPYEAKTVLNSIFPEGMAAADYYDYAIKEQIK